MLLATSLETSFFLLCFFFLTQAFFSPKIFYGVVSIFQADLMVIEVNQSAQRYVNELEKHPILFAGCHYVLNLEFQEENVNIINDNITQEWSESKGHPACRLSCNIS